VNFLQMILAPFRWVINGIFPMFFGGPIEVPAGGARFGRAKAVLWWIFHAVLLIAILVGLYFLNHWLRLDRHIRVKYPLLREGWLPILFLLFYVLCWLGRALWKLLGPEQVEAGHPEVDRAWVECLTGLGEAGVGITEAPLFLVLGRPAGTERSLFNAGGLRLAVKQVPRRADAPVAVSANADAVFVTTGGASLLSRYAGLLHGIDSGSAVSDEEAAESGSAEGAPGGGSASAPARIAPDLVAAAPKFEAFPGQEAGLATSPVGLATREAEPELAPATSTAATTVERARTLLLRDAEEVELQLGRLRHLCRLLARDRKPYTPLNGILVVIPAAAGASEAASREVATLCQRDLETVREFLQVDCPIAAMVCDLEQVPGFGDFIAFYPEGQRKRFLGQQFPLVPDLDATGKVRMVERGVQWVANVQFPSLIYKNWKPEAAGPGDVPPARSSNARLYRFLTELRERQRRIARVLTRGVVMPSGGRAMLGACGFAATGRDLVREQGFASGAFRWLIDNQNQVAWTPEAITVDAEFRRGARLGYFGLLGLFIALAVLAIYLWPRG
jgi:hypothetical protein